MLIKLFRYLHALAGPVFILFVLFILLNSFVITPYQVSGESMESTLFDGQWLVVNLLEYVARAPSKGDIVIVSLEQGTELELVKRIAGIPGDVVKVNGQEVLLGKEDYYLLGDNSAHSTDSRVFGPVKRKQILGRVWQP